MESGPLWAFRGGEMTAEDIIALAKTQLGVSENPPGSNNVIYNTEYYGAPSDLPWCVVFIWWLFKELGASDLFCGGQKTAWCDFVRDYAIQHGQWVTDNYKPGDLVLFNWDGGSLDHIGLAISVNGNSVTTIEGNCNDKVSQMMRTGSTLVGAYRPKYSSPGQSDVPKPAPPADRYTVKKGDTLWGIAERLLGAGERYIQIMTANNLNDSMIYPGQELIIPTGEASYVTINVTITRDTYELLQIMADGWNKTIGQCIDALMEDAV